ncbi:hypothetical protein GmHk_U059970 [Glycine max]|nr:hypothetical protein GmHk_U059970 [Glycine max]
MTGQIREELRTQLEEENKRSLEIMTMALKEAIKKELSHKGSPESLLIQPDIQQLGAPVNTNGSNVVINVQPSWEHGGDVIPMMGLYVQRKDGTLGLVAMGKIMEGDSVIHTVAYADDVVRDVEIIPHNEDAHVPKPANVDADDPLRGLIKYSFDIYEKPVEINFDGSCFGIADAPTSIFITYSDVSEIIAGDKSLNISVQQLWLIHLERWLKESDREVYVGPYFHQAHWQLVLLCPRQHVVVWLCSLRRKLDMHIKAAINNVMTKLKTTLSPKSKVAAPKWIEVKSHVQTGCYECGYYVMHWMWNIITSEIKSDWSMWFADATSLDIDNITTIRNKWARYFLKTACKKG